MKYPDSLVTEYASGMQQRERSYAPSTATSSRISILKIRGYLRQGVLIHSTQTGLIHYLEPEATFQLLERMGETGLRWAISRRAEEQAGDDEHADER
jgi:hypothetical protein